MKTYTIKFEHSKWGVIRQCGFEARNRVAALARGAKALGLKAKRNKDGYGWQFWDESGGEINCYLLLDCYAVN